ncbi:MULTISPECIES: hypothetical protein [unclassified Microbacterium]|uniref:hypothetical protein n=1 Tax=unclassified Microbacterium TaxID=2609290 RepID=UPI000AA97309|nr:hypothetical protein [Microbacterium sp. GCS4]
MVNEPFVYLLTVLLAVSAGLGFGVKAAGVHRWLGQVAGILVTAFVVVVGFMIGAHAVWIGPIFLLVSMVTTVVVGVSGRRNEPMFLASSYWRRVLLVSRGYKSEPGEASGDAGRPCTRIDRD